MNLNAIQLGSFHLHEVIGRGGMGDVWRATHAHQGIDVAVKVLTSSRARKPRAIEAFRNEVHAVARLDHPGIIMVLDVGEVDEQAALDGQGVLTAGSPFLAMELATHGTLDRVRDGLHWRRLRAVMLSILDALSHAHARGVVHRDLKPGNVLATTDHRGKSVLKLADFGLAHAVGAPGRKEKERKISGTPKYMAPEQIEGRIRDQGPWTDLYALGCLGYWLVNDTAPFTGELEEILSGHLFEEVPPLDDLRGAPDAFRGWLDRLLEKDPRRRFRTAADAAYGLMLIDDRPASLDRFGDGLGEVTDSRWTEPELSVLDQTIVMLSNASTRPGSRSSKPLDGFSATIVDAEIDVDTGTERAGDAVELAARPPLPADWRRTEGERRPMKLVGAGLGLYGLRPVPMVDRETERSSLWDALHEVHQQHDARVAVLVGAAGSGKSRLADWVCERALEVGAATPLRAVHAPESVVDGLAQMVAERLRCDGLDHEAVVERVHDFYFSTGAVDGQDVYDCAALTEMISPATDDKNVVRFTRPVERYVVLARFLERLSRERPLILWLDDVQWSLDALEFVSFFLGTGRRTPVLIALTVRQEALSEDAPESNRLLEIAEDARTRVLDIEPLLAEHHSTLVGELLSLAPSLAEQVAQRTAGNPLFAVQLVGDWVQRGVLEVTEDGFRVADGTALHLPDSIHEMWLDRLDGFVDAQSLTELEIRQIELAAVLGAEIDIDEWRTAAHVLDDAEPEALLVSKLAADGLVRRSPRGFSFSHGMLQESLVRLADERFRTASYHQAAAAMIEQLHDMRRPEVLERYGTHLFEAGDWNASLEPLLHAATVLGERSEFERVKRLVSTRERALDALGAAPTDERRGEGWHVAVRCLLRQGLVDEAGALIERAVQMARENDWPTIAPEFELHLGSLARKRGDSEGAVRQYRCALEAFDPDDSNGRAKCLYGIGEVLLYRGDVERAVEYLQRALETMRERGGDDAGVVLTGLASALIRVDAFDDARDHLNEAIELLRRVGNRGGRAAALNVLGELERARGELPDAERAYLEAIDVLGSIGSRGVTIPRLNLGLVYLGRSNWSEARQTLALGMDELLAIGEMSHVGFVHLGIACGAAGEGDWEAFDHHLNACREILEASEWVDRDIARHAELAAAIADAAGEDQRAGRAATLAREQWDALGAGPVKTSDASN